MRGKRGADMSDYIVTVVGTTGKTGREVARQAGANGWRVRPTSRQPSAHGNWTRLDLDEPET